MKTEEILNEANEKRERGKDPKRKTGRGEVTREANEIPIIANRSLAKRGLISGFVLRGARGRAMVRSETEKN